MTDWLNKLTAKEKLDWDRFVQHARTETFRGISSASMIISLAPEGKPDAKFCVELGMSIMLNKPIIIISSNRRPVPGKLRQIADEVAEKMKPILEKYTK